MSVLFFWRGDNYFRDMQTGKGYHLNQNNEIIYKLRQGEHIWAFTRRKDKTYVLAADLVVISTKQNQPGDDGVEYGKYHAGADKQRSRYFNVNKGPDAEPTIRSLSFSPKARILGSSFQGSNGVRILSSTDEQKLINFSSRLLTI
jgi:hypothetical protein